MIIERQPADGTGSGLLVLEGLQGQRVRCAEDQRLAGLLGRILLRGQPVTAFGLRTNTFHNVFKPISAGH